MIYLYIHILYPQLHHGEALDWTGHYCNITTVRTTVSHSPPCGGVEHNIVCFMISLQSQVNTPLYQRNLVNIILGDQKKIWTINFYSFIINLDRSDRRSQHSLCKQRAG